MRRTIPAAASLLVVTFGAALLAFMTPTVHQAAMGKEIWRVESLHPQDGPATSTVWKGIEIASTRVQPMPAPNALDDYCLSSIGASEGHPFLKTSGHSWAIGDRTK